MHWMLFALAGIGLIAAHLLRLPNRVSLMGGTLAFLAGLAMTAMGIRMGANTAGIGHATDFDAFVNHGVAQAAEDDAPLIVFSGASYSRNALNDERLTAALRARGYPHKVINLSLEAASLMERDAHIRDFLDRSPRMPDAVFLEVSEVTDYRPTFMFDNSKFTSRAIEQFDLDTTLWTGIGLAGGGCNGAVDCAKNSVFLGAHSLMNMTNIGLIGQGEVEADVAPKTSFDGLTEAREDIDAAARSKQLSEPGTAPRPSPSWAMNFRKLEREEILRTGPRAVGYYFPPVIPADARAYVADVCANELADFTCIAPTDPALLSALDADVWLDEGHVQDAGAAIYVDWLADQLILSGVLGAPSLPTETPEP